MHHAPDCTCILEDRWSDGRGYAVKVIVVFDPDCDEWEHRVNAGQGAESR